ncbi:MAG: hypothetical protein LBT76_04065 [Tannerella sp.]|jgi:hypothetical protein|nr:hypothetical protein [Tannerella sp.]
MEYGFEETVLRREKAPEAMFKRSKGLQRRAPGFFMHRFLPRASWMKRARKFKVRADVADFNDLSSANGWKKSKRYGHG